jgi:hypothetical protein
MHAHSTRQLSLQRSDCSSWGHRLLSAALAAVVAAHLATAPVFCVRFQESAYAHQAHHPPQPNEAAAHHDAHATHSRVAHAHGAMHGAAPPPAESKPSSDHAGASSHSPCDFCLAAAFALTQAAPRVSLQHSERVIVWRAPRIAAPFSEIRTQHSRAPPAV